MTRPTSPEPPSFASREDALLWIEAKFGPPDDPWDLTMPRVSWSAEDELLTRFGALPMTMHFGLTEVDLRAGLARFWDQDHRDGGDDLVHSAELPESWIERIRALEA